MDDSDTLPPPFLTRLEPKPARMPPGDGELEELIAPGNAFAVARGLSLPATLKFLHPDGRLRFALAYGRLPTIWDDGPGVLVLEYSGFGSVIVAGENLGLLETRLCEYRVTWIRPCGQPQAPSSGVIVTRIERMQRYPSREPDDAGE